MSHTHGWVPTPEDEFFARPLNLDKLLIKHPRVVFLEIVNNGNRQVATKPLAPAPPTIQASPHTDPE
jgi:hypothetical protein